MYECDGCGFTGTLEEVNKHCMDNATLADGSFKDPADIVCWGAMAVGGQAWEDYHGKGIHPMTDLMQFATNLVETHNLIKREE